MISKEECMNMVLQRVPQFSERWQAHLNYWQREQAGLCLDIAEFAHFVIDLIKGRQTEDLPGIFDIIEELMVDGDENVRTAVATCFLENLLNLVPDRLPPERFVHLLGPASRTYCIAWDTFTGIPTPDLHEGQNI